MWCGVLRVRVNDWCRESRSLEAQADFETTKEIILFFSFLSGWLLNMPHGGVISLPVSMFTPFFITHLTGRRGRRAPHSIHPMFRKSAERTIGRK